MKVALCRGVLLLVLLLVPGCLFGNFGHPLDTNLDQTTLGTKVGESSSYSVLWLVAWGDSGSAAAAREGGITTLRHMDAHEFMILWGVFAKSTTIVYGD